jgi:hypothetical protein
MLWFLPVLGGLAGALSAVVEWARFERRPLRR